MRTNFNNQGKPFRGRVFGMAVLLFLLGSVGVGLAQETGKEFDYGKVSLRVGVWMDELGEDGILQRGQEMTVGFQTNADAYAVVYRIDTEGEVTILWPRSRMDDGFVFGGHEYMLPVAGARRLAASSRSGEGFVEVLASPYPFDLRQLEVDFHHEYKAENYDFAVVGDPFLAMNEINYAITRMEDTEDFVVSNYLSYYVHEKVEHPRYLCNQCHFDDDVTVHPYQDHCTINITFDYGWANRWYLDYGYYPVYYNPIYVYYDPWTWRPWVNFWYDPWYRCVSRPSWHWRDPVYVWCDSPYYRDYRFDGVRRKEGRGLFQGEPGKDRRTKTGDFRSVSRMVADNGPSESQRESMRTKERTERSLLPGGTGAAVVRGGSATGRVSDGTTTGRVSDGGTPSLVRGGELPLARTRTQIEKRESADTRTRGGLQIRRPETGRTVDGSSRTRVGVTPVSRGSGSTDRSGGSVDRSGGSVDRTSEGSGKIQPVEPRRQTTRIWNNNRSSRSEDRESSGSSGSSSSNTRTRSNDRSGSSGSTVESSRSKGSSSSNSSMRSGGSRSGSSSGGSSGGSSGSSSGSSSGGSVKSRGSSSGNSSSSSGRTSGGGSSGSSGSSRSGGSSSSRSSGSSRTGR